MKKILVVGLVMVFLFIIVVPYASAQPKTFKWKYLSYIPSTTGCGNNSEWMLSQIEKRSGGRMTFERYWAAALAPPAEYPKMLNANIVQWALLGTGYTPDIFQLARFFDLQYLTEDAEAFAAVSLKLYETYAPLREEFTKNGMMYYWPNVGAHFTIVSRTPAYKWEDLRGKKIRIYGQQAPLYKKWGATGVNIPFSEAYQALERGTFDVMTGVMFVSHIGMKYHEVAPCIIDIGEGAFGLFPEAISLRAWNELPDDLKAIFMQVQKDALTERWTRIEPEFEKANIEVFKKAGTKVIVWSEEEKKRGFRQGLPDVYSIYFDEMKKRGAPAEAFRELFDKEMKAYRKANPKWLWVPPTWTLCSEKEGGVWQNGVCSPAPK